MRSRSSPASRRDRAIRTASRGAVCTANRLLLCCAVFTWKLHSKPQHREMVGFEHRKPSYRFVATLGARRLLMCN
jgi:hypothetical protein